MVAAEPEAVIHQLTDLPQQMTPGEMKAGLEATNRVRTKGTANLLAAAARPARGGVVAQSIAFAYAPKATGLYDESDPLFVDAPPPGGDAASSVAELERQVTNGEGIEGLALRFGFWYGAGTAYASDGHWAERGAKAAAADRRQRLGAIRTGTK